MVKKLDFDINSPFNIGRPFYWHLEDHIASIEQMIRADELQIAIRMCDDIPAWYRMEENYPKELDALKKNLWRQTYDLNEYCHDDEEAECTREFGEAQWDNGYMYPRAEIISSIVDQLNNMGKTPWIFDLGCSHGNLPLGLIKTNRKFTYLGQATNRRILAKVKAWTSVRWKERPPPESPTILYCTEVIEHCFDTQSVVHSSHKIGVDFDFIVLSVPNCCLGGGLPDWRTRRIGHVRGWTPDEFLSLARSNWRGYKWVENKTPSMVLVGQKCAPTREIENG